VWNGLIYVEGERPAPGFTKTVLNTERTNFARIIGVDPKLERSVSGLDKWLTAVDASSVRRVRDPNHPFQLEEDQSEYATPGMLLGFDRAEQDGVGVGRRITIASARNLGAQGIIRVKYDFVLTGTFKSQHKFFDRSAVLVDIWTLRSIFGQDPREEGSIDVFNEISIKLKDYTRADQVVLDLEKTLKDHHIAGRVLTWEQRQKRLLTTVDSERGMMKLVLIVLMVVATFLIFATLSMMVTEKTKDIGILSALGATRRGILAIFVFCGLSISIIGTGIGTVVGYISCINLTPFNDWLHANFGMELFPRRIFDLNEVPYQLDAAWMIQVGVLAIVLAGVFSFFPALRAARFDPVRALRYE